MRCWCAVRGLQQALHKCGLFSAELQFTLSGCCCFHRGNVTGCQGAFCQDGSGRFLSSSDKQRGLESMLPAFGGKLPIFGGELPVFGELPIFGGELAFP